MLATCSKDYSDGYVITTSHYWCQDTGISIKNKTVSKDRHKEKCVRNSVGIKKICKQFMQSSIAPFYSPRFFFHVSQIPQASIKKQRCGLMKFVNLSLIRCQLRAPLSASPDPVLPPLPSSRPPRSKSTLSLKLHVSSTTARS